MGFGIAWMPYGKSTCASHFQGFPVSHLARVPAEPAAGPVPFSGWSCASPDSQGGGLMFFWHSPSSVWLVFWEASDFSAYWCACGIRAGSVLVMLLKVCEGCYRGASAEASEEVGQCRYCWLPEEMGGLYPSKPKSPRDWHFFVFVLHSFWGACGNHGFTGGYVGWDVHP